MSSVYIEWLGMFHLGILYDMVGFSSTFFICGGLLFVATLATLFLLKQDSNKDIKEAESERG